MPSDRFKWHFQVMIYHTNYNLESDENTLNFSVTR